MPNSSILRIYSDKDIIKVDPEYQRKGDVWTLEKKQLLIDSIINEYDIPKLYFHSLNNVQKKELEVNYDVSIIDGRQRIQTIFEFIDGIFPLADDFEYLADDKIRAGGMTYSALAVQYPKLKIRYDAFTLPIILVETEDLDLIEDMFSRLNEAVPLNAAEKRNAIGGDMAKSIREMVTHTFFTNKVKFKNNRLQHNEVAAKLLFLEHSLQINKKIFDTKKPYLDKMVEEYRTNPNLNFRPIFTSAISIIDLMNNCFVNNDILLKTQSPLTIYYLVFRFAQQNGLINSLNRQKIADFYQSLEENRLQAEQDITKANYEYLEFDRLSQQGTNDTSSIRERTKIMSEYLGLIKNDKQQTMGFL